MEYLWLMGAIAALIGTTRGLSRVMVDAPVGTPQPDIELPTQWGASIPDMQRVYPRSHTPANPVHHYGSAFSVISEPSTVVTGFQPSPGDVESTANPVGHSGSAEPDVVALLALTPFETVGTVSPDEFQLFSLLKTQKRKQSEIIKTLYHVARGGTQAYEKARDRYLFILKLYLETKES
jgi:hypothetical protein